MTWSYIPVYREYPRPNGVERVYSLCEVYFDEADMVKSWTLDPEMSPCGADPAELVYTLELMTRDAKRWRPIPFTSLAPGITLKKRFAIGDEFLTLTGRWRVTDVGTWTVIAIRVDRVGPPYAVVERIFDETDDLVSAPPA